MVRKYVRNINCGSYGSETLKIAMDAVARKEMTKAEALKRFEIPRSTIAKRLKNSTERPSGLGRFKRVFDESYERNSATMHLKCNHDFTGSHCLI